MKFTITGRCEKGHTVEIDKDLPDLPGREWADELARLFGTKCSVCDAPIKYTVQQPDN
jgi:hypothetical protein